MLKFH
jgi:mannose-1-phosphate guanylyltransferase